MAIRGLAVSQCVAEDVLSRFQHTIEPSQHDQWQHYLAVLRRPIGTAQLVRDAPDEISKFLVTVGDHYLRSRVFLVGVL
jgi:hypothetical protein